MEAKSLPPEDYTVGWICAISTELMAARAMLDSTHGPLEHQPKHDENNYTLGSIGKHNVVLACLPEYGVVSAAVVAKSMQSTFPSLRFGLMVGIGGGIPSAENDIRLGDIVVSLPTGEHGGVIQYDLGRMEAGGFRRLGMLNKPPTLLRTAVQTLRATFGIEEEISDLVNTAFKNHRKWIYPKTAEDILFKATFNHIEESPTCSPCAKYTSEIVKREPRESNDPSILYGNIGSGNTVMKNGVERDTLATREKIICFEMEAAGLMDNFPCLVIRGICDYADSHKNLKWQPYAAAVAAAEPPLDSSSFAQPVFHRTEGNPFYTPQAVMRNRDKQTEKIRHIRDWWFCFWGIFWIDISDEESIKRGTIDAVKRARGMEEIGYEDAKLWFSNLDKSWLLIFDNADDTSIDYSKFFPSGTKGTILLTTRNGECKMYGTVGSQDSGKLAFDDAITILLKSAGLEEMERNKLEAQELVGDEVLAQHALAITQAGAFIRAGLCRLEEYRAMFEAEQKILLTFRPEQAQSIYGDVYATFEVSANAMKRSAKPEWMDALKLLEVLAFFNREGIPEEIFTRAWAEGLKVETHQDSEYIDCLSRWHVDHLKGILHENEDTGTLDLVRLRKARRVLVSFSLVTINAKTKDMSMHPLVHAWARDRLSHESQLVGWATAASFLSLSAGDLHNQEIFNQMQVHVESCLKHQPPDVFNIPQYPPMEICRILYFLAWLLLRAHSADAAKKLAHDLLSRSEGAIQAQSLNWYYLQYLLALCQDYLGKHEEAAQLLKELIAWVEANNEDPTMAREALGWAYARLGRTSEAVDLLQDIVHARQALLPPTHPDLLTSQHNLASLYTSNGQPEKAIELLQQIIQIRQKMLSPTHPDLLTSQHELARAYTSNNQPKKAIELLQQIIQIRQKILSPTHPELLTSQHELAHANFQCGEYRKALPIIQKVVDIKGKISEPGNQSRHSKAENAMSNIGDTELSDCANTNTSTSSIQGGEDADARVSSKKSRAPRFMLTPMRIFLRKKTQTK
ncbi:hypothetical protein B7463_g8648, partial [Scytalidium lignicola]